MHILPRHRCSALSVGLKRCWIVTTEENIVSIHHYFLFISSPRLQSAVARHASPAFLFMFGGDDILKTAERQSCIWWSWLIRHSLSECRLQSFWEEKLNKEILGRVIERKKGDEVEKKTNDNFLEWPPGSLYSTDIFFLPKQPRTLN